MTRKKKKKMAHAYGTSWYMSLIVSLSNFAFVSLQFYPLTNIYWDMLPCMNIEYNASIHTATLKVIDTVLIATGILYLSSLLKLSILFADFLHASNVTVMIISSYLSPIMRKPV